MHEVQRSGRFCRRWERAGGWRRDFLEDVKDLLAAAKLPNSAQRHHDEEGNAERVDPNNRSTLSAEEEPELPEKPGEAGETENPEDDPRPAFAKEFVEIGNSDRKQGTTKTREESDLPVLHLLQGDSGVE